MNKDCEDDMIPNTRKNILPYQLRTAPEKFEHATTYYIQFSEKYTGEKENNDSEECKRMRGVSLKEEADYSS